MSTLDRAKYIDGEWFIPVKDFHEVRDALNMAVHYAQNLERIQGDIPVRDLDESLGGYLRAKKLSEQLEGRTG